MTLGVIEHSPCHLARSYTHIETDAQRSTARMRASQSLLALNPPQKHIFEGIYMAAWSCSLFTARHTDAASYIAVL